jgi:myosin-crossreactive antigen
MAKFTAGQMTAIAEKAGFNKNDAKIMGAIGMAESSGDPNAHNDNPKTKDNSYGLWQINMRYHNHKELQIHTNEDLFVPFINADAAHRIFKSQGFKAWSTYKNGDYKKYLSQADADKATQEELDKNPMESSPIGEALSGVTDSASAVFEIANDIGKAAAWISTPSNWLRVLYIVGGGIVIVAGIAYLAKDTAIQGVAGSAIKGLKSGTKSLKNAKKVT